jgi:selenide,water dikinase
MLSDELALVQTVDVITPVVDDPYVFGQISAANAMSDVYAMGGRPVTALNIAGIPICDFDDDLIVRIQEGSLSKLKEAGCNLMGGHTVDDMELKYGLAITGLVHPEKVYYNSRVRVTDKLILTKPIGNGIITTAYKANIAAKKDYNNSVKNMVALNKTACEIMMKYDVSACTDISGFGLLGHTFEAAHSSGVSVELEYDAIPMLDGAYEYASMGLVPAGSHGNEAYLKDRFDFKKPNSKTDISVLCDPQTSGGLLIFVKKNNAKKLLKDLKDNSIIHAQIIGSVIEKNEKTIYIL